MIDPITKDIEQGRVVIGPCRISFPHVFEKNSYDNGEPKYSAVVLIPKSEKATLDALHKAAENAKKNKWGDKAPRGLKVWIQDGDEKENTDFHGHYFVSAKSSTRPGVVDKHKVPIVDEEEIYGGVWAYVSVTMYGYESNGSKGVACALNNLMKFKDGERLGGGHRTAEEDFDGLDFDDDDDDDDL